MNHNQENLYFQNPSYNQPPQNNYPNNPPHPYLQPAKKPLYKRPMFWLIFVLTLILVFSVSIWAILKIAYSQDADLAAKTCQERVLDWAKHPGGASFPEPIEMKTDQGITDIELTFTAEGEVDFPNGFGTPVRSEYTCEVVIDSGAVANSWAWVSESSR